MNIICLVFGHIPVGILPLSPKRPRNVTLKSVNCKRCNKEIYRWAMKQAIKEAPLTEFEKLRLDKAKESASDDIRETIASFNNRLINQFQAGAKWAREYTLKEHNQNEANWSQLMLIKEAEFKTQQETIEKLKGALEGWQSWAESMVDEGVLDDSLVNEYHVASKALKEAEGDHS